MKRPAPAALLLWCAGMTVWLACNAGDWPRGDEAENSPAAAAYVGGQVCRDCHADETRRWQASHHDLAMQEATAETVLGDFADASLEHFGERFAFHRRDDRFIIRTGDAEGAPKDFEVTHTFGVDPLQQYLVRFPGGRLQAVGVAWDTRPASEGGQRWFHLHADEVVPPGDALHWTGRAGSWNAMCAECHSTNLSKGYDAESDHYAASWTNINVSCEACHGPGSAHLAWAARGVEDIPDLGLVVPLGQRRAWRFAEGSPIAHRVPATEGPDTEVETCAACHARRSRIAEEEVGSDFLDTFRPALLEEGLYHADGQILDEVYVWGSFLQSRMQGAGVVCSDCHDPHALRIEEPDAVCSGCHRSETFAVPAHHRHGVNSPGASCVACHMPTQTYMGVDARRDHSFRVPRPDLTQAIGVPNACSSCHQQQPASAAEAIVRWRGSHGPPKPHYGEVLRAGQRRAPGASEALAALSQDKDLPPIVRATAIQLLERQLTARALPALRAAVVAPEPLLRMAAAGAAEALPIGDRWNLLKPLLHDELRAVRIEAGRVLAPLLRDAREPDARHFLTEALTVYRAAQALQSDRPEARVALGILDADLGRLNSAQRELEAALRLGPDFLPAYINLADLLRVRDRDAAGERVLRLGLTRFPERGEIRHALGLLLVRTGRPEEALKELRGAAEIAPEIPRFVQVYALALNASGQRDQAIAVLAAAHENHPSGHELLMTLVRLQRDAGNLEEALHYARKLANLRPEKPAATSLLRDLESEATHNE